MTRPSVDRSLLQVTAEIMCTELQRSGGGEMVIKPEYIAGFSPSTGKMVVKIYGMASAVCAQRVMLCLVEKGVAFEIQVVDLAKGEQKLPPYTAMQPFEQVPCILDGDFKLFESRAIARYYASKSDNGPNLMGISPEDRALVEQWMDVEAINFNPLVFPVVFNLYILPKQGIAGNKTEAGASARKLSRVLDVYEKQLSKTKYLAGSYYTLADLTHIPTMRALLENCGMAELLEGRMHLKAWWEDISSRPAAKKVEELAASGALAYSP